MMRLTKACLIPVFLSASFLCSARSCPADTVALWKNCRVDFGNEVSLYAFRPQKPNGISTVICPGGSYFWLDSEGEGFAVAEWLVSQGITAFVLEYRTAGCAEFSWHTRSVFRGKRYPDMLADAQRAMQYVWENAGEYNIDRDKIGVMGFSAGGHLALCAACFSSTDFLSAMGIHTDAPKRPAFVAAVYPVVTMENPYAHKRSRRGLLGDRMARDARMRDSLSVEKHIPDNCPPVFFVNCKDDKVVNPRNSELLDEALSGKNIPHKYICYNNGNHGFGVCSEACSPESREWTKEFLDWLKELYSSIL